MRSPQRTASPPSMPESHETFMRRLNNEAHAAMTRLEAPCPWCGIDCIDTRDQHEQYARQSESTWRGAA